MATSWTAGTGDFMRPLGRGTERIKNFPEGASQAFKRGYPVIFSAVAGFENDIIVWTADLTTGVIGVACENASGTRGTNISVWMAEPNIEFRARVQDTGVVDATDVGKQRGLVIDTTNLICRVDLSETVATLGTITEILAPTLDGDTNALVAFIFKPAVRGINPG